jgi:2-polyprenyl-3-methyl-5-hydroxy-6-metoxy-1,4-benzoquinol methylase
MSFVIHEPRPENLRFAPCDLCGHTHFLIVSDRDRHGQPLQTVVCHDCGLVSTNPRPTDEELEQFYREEYRKSYKQAVKPKPKHVYRAGRVALERLSYLLPLLRPGQSVLDMGAGGGELLFLLRGLGYAVQGIEPNLGYGGSARDTLGLPVQVTHYQHAKVEPGSLDVVTCFHVLEHLAHPIEALSIMGGWAKPGGLLLIEVPNVMSRCQWPSSRYHLGHLHHFSSSTLCLAGQKAGLTPVDTFTSSDGGNLMVVFRKDEAPAIKLGAIIPGHALRVLKHLQGHTAMNHLLSRHPYLRPWAKLFSRIQERAALMRHQDAHSILDHLLVEARLVAEKLRKSERPSEPEQDLPCLLSVA